MARFNYSGVAITGGTGRLNSSLGGTVLLRNGVVRNYVTPVNPQTAIQQVTRSVFSFLTSSWVSLSNDQRAEWETARNNDPAFQKSDPFTGTSRKYSSGKALFIGMNYNILEATDSLGMPSVVYSTPGTVSFVSDVLATDIAFSAAGGTAALTFSGAKDMNEELVLFATEPVSAGNMRATSVQSKFRYLTQNIAASPSAQGAAYTTRFGAITAKAGMKVFWMLFSVDSDTGIKKLAGSGDSIIGA